MSPHAPRSDNAAAAPKSSLTPQLIGGRYRVEDILGIGGMGVVYRVHDQATGRSLALKRLVADDERIRDRATQLFQREYQTLMHLKHPRVIEVYDYAVSEGAPYYTMELLDGGDLSQTHSLDYRAICALLCDVASALALLHSRRWVHRDITPRNIRRTADGRAKLFDFGTLAPMGASAMLVGTAPYVAPEALHGQPLDGRVDLYALGAVAYVLLTGRDAYPARNFGQLKEYFRSEPRAPNALVPAIPAQLSAFVLSLLSLNPLGRPVTAWEVIDRLSAIAQLAHDDQHGDALAYLVTPTLVGRDRELQTARERLLNARGGRGVALCVEGPAGSGRSRVLAALALEARLLGFPVLRADGAEGGQGNFVVLARLLRQLCELDVKDTQPQPFEVERVIHSAEQPLTREQENALLADGREPLVHFLLARAQAHGLMIAIDDAELMDPASSAVMRELTQAAPQHKLIIALTLRCEPGEEGAQSEQILRRDATVLQLRPLSAIQTEALMRSVFGDTAHLRPLSHLIQRWAQGNPAACMRMAQQLLDRGAVHYQAGRWVLPDDLAQLEPSFEIESAFAGRVRALGPGGRSLAEALALTAISSPVDPADYGALLDEPDELAALAALTELIEADVLRAKGNAYGFSHPALVEVLASGIKPARSRSLNLRLAALYEHGRRRERLMQAVHLQRAGEGENAFDLLLELVPIYNSGQMTAGANSNAWYGLAAPAYLEALAHGIRARASPRALFEFRRVLVGLASTYDSRLLEHALPLIEQLVIDTGLCYFSQLSNDDPAHSRMERCVERARQRYEAQPEHERCFNPREALQMLALVANSLCGIYARSQDLTGLEILPPLMEPLRELDPAFAISAEIVRITILAVRGEDATPPALALMARIDSDPVLRAQPLMLVALGSLRYYVGLREASRGGRAAIGRADEIEARTRMWEKMWPASVGLGRFRSWHVRLIAHLYNGDVRRAKRCREQIELLQLDGVDPAVRPFLRTSVHLEARAHAMSGSLGELRETIDVIEALAATTPTWQPVLHWARGEYHKARGDYDRARFELSKARDLTAPGRHQVWIWASAALTEVLLACGETRLAQRLASQALSACEGLQLAAYLRCELARALALCEARLGDYERAASLLDDTIADSLGELGGVPLGRLYEARARVALQAGDIRELRHYARLTQQRYRPGHHPGLCALHQKLMEDADQLGPSEDIGNTPRFEVVPADLRRSLNVTETVQTALRGADPAERGTRALELMLEHARSPRGYLFGKHADDLHLLASLPEAGDGVIAAALLRELEPLIGRNLGAVTEVQGERAATIDRISLEDGMEYAIVLLSSAQTNGIPIAVAALQMIELTPSRIPWRLAGAIADFLLEQGMVTSIETR